MKHWTIVPQLKFSKELEHKYLLENALKDKQYIRVSLSLFALLYALFSWTDYVFVYQWFSLFFVIRFVIVIPVFLITILLTYTPFYYPNQQFILLLNYIVGGIGISIMLILEPLNILYYGGLFLIFTSGYFIIHLKTSYAISGGITILLSFILGVSFANKLSLEVISAALFLLAENLIGGIGSYQLERLKRLEYLNIHNLNKSHARLNTMVNEKIEEITFAQMSTINALASLAESRDKETGEHIERVGELCFQISGVLPDKYFQSTSEKADFSHAIRLASALHDIGKVGIADAILNKPGPLTEEEFKVMSTHPSIGSETLKKLYEQYPNNSFVKLGIEITHSHHEWWDGTGYPDGLKGLDIPLSARIMAIADVYDALISKRPYKPPFTHDRAVEIIKSESGKHFDPELVEFFCRLYANKDL
jgi:hypothetical protein